MHHRRALITQHAQGLGDRQHQFRAVDANQRQRRMRRVDQRAQHVEQGAGLQLLTDRHRVAETGVVLRREQEADAQLIKRGAGFIGVHIEINAEGRQQVRRA